MRARAIGSCPRAGTGADGCEVVTHAGGLETPPSKRLGTRRAHPARRAGCGCAMRRGKIRARIVARHPLVSCVPAGASSAMVLTRARCVVGAYAF